MKNLKLINPKKILIIKPSSLGDIVHSLPFLNSISKCFPKAEIHWLVAREFKSLLEGHSMIKKLWTINKSEWRKISRVHATVSEINKLTKALRAEKYDCVIDLQGLFRSGFMAKAANAPVRIGFADAREGAAFFYNQKVKGGKDIHAVDLYLRVAAFLGCDTSDIRFPFPPFETISLNLPVNGPYAVISPGSKNKSKIWPAGRFGELSSLLPIKSIIVGSKSDAGIADKVSELSHGKAVSVAGKTDLKELIAIIKGAEFMICNDTGPMHIADALGVPVVALFGPTNPVRTGPYGKGHTIIRKDVPCAPCYKKSCGNLKCLEMIGVNEVYEAIIKGRLLNNKL